MGEPSLDDPKRTVAPDVTKENVAMFNEATKGERSRRAGRGQANRAE